MSNLEKLLFAVKVVAAASFLTLCTASGFLAAHMPTGAAAVAAAAATAKASGLQAATAKASRLLSHLSSSSPAFWVAAAATAVLAMCWVKWQQWQALMRKFVFEDYVHADRH